MPQILFIEIFRNMLYIVARISSLLVRLMRFRLGAVQSIFTECEERLRLQSFIAVIVTRVVVFREGKIQCYECRACHVQKPRNSAEMLDCSQKIQSAIEGSIRTYPTLKL